MQLFDWLKYSKVLAPHPTLAFIAEAVGEDATGAHLFDQFRMNHPEVYP